MNPSLYYLVLLIAVKMLTVKSAPRIPLRAGELPQNHEYSDAKQIVVDKDYNKEQKDFSEASDGGHEMITTTSGSTAATQTFTPGTEERTADQANEAAAVMLLKRALRNKRRAQRCPGGQWGCDKQSGTSSEKSHHNQKSHHKQQSRE